MQQLVDELDVFEQKIQGLIDTARARGVRIVSLGRKTKAWKLEA